MKNLLRLSLLVFLGCVQQDPSPDPITDGTGPKEDSADETLCHAKPDVFALFLDRYDTFYLTRTPDVRLPGGVPVFPDVPARSPEDIAAKRGKKVEEVGGYGQG